MSADSALASYLGIMSVPTFLIGLRQDDENVRIVKRLSGNRMIAEFDAVLDGLIVVSSHAVSSEQRQEKGTRR